MGRIGALLQQRLALADASEPPSAETTPTRSRIGDVLRLRADLARRQASVSPTGLEATARAISATALAPFVRIPQAIQSEVVRLSTTPSFQAYAPAIGAMLRQPLETLQVPTSSGLMVGTPAGVVLRGLEHQAQGQVGAAFGDVMLYEGGTLLSRLAAGMTSRIGQALRNRLVTTGRIAPEIIEPAIRRTAITPTAPIQEAEVLQPPRALTFQPGEGIVAEGGARALPIPPQPIRPVSTPSELRPPAVAVRPPSVSVQELASTHPGLVVHPTATGQLRLPATQLLGDHPELHGKFLIPISRTTADALQDQSVELARGSLASRVVRLVPESVQQTGQATGLQYWYAFDLPPSTGVRHVPRSVPTRSEAAKLEATQGGSPQVSEQPPTYQVGQGPKPLRPLVRVRQQAIQAITRDLAEQANLLMASSRSLRISVMQAGGIRPTLAGGMREELQAIRPFLRSKGQPIDQLATELGFEDGETLRQALLSTQGQKHPTIAQLRTEAMRIVDSDQGSRILDAIQTQGFTSHAVKRMVREVTRETERVISQGNLAVRGILRRAEQQSITPTQLARLARTQRLEPGATVTGPRGGLKEAPLSQPDIAQVEQRVGQVVPPRGPHVTGTPPKIPTGRSLIVRSATPQEYPYRDLTEFQAARLSGLEPYRVFHLIDGNRRGPSTTGIYEPTLAVTRRKADEEQTILERLNRLVPNLRAKTPEDTALMALGEGKLSSTDVTPRLLRAAGEMRETYDSLLKRVNAVRVRDGKLPIPARQNYMPHLRAQTLMSEVFGGFEKIPDDAVNVVIGDIHPNSPYAWFQNRREGGPSAKSAIEAYQAWVGKALESIHYPDVIQTVRPRMQNLPPRARQYATEYIDQVLARRPHSIDLIPPPTLLRWIDQQRRQTSQGAVSGNVLSFFNQVLTMPATVSSAGPVNTTRAALSLSGNAIQRFVNDLAGKVGIQTAAEALLKAHQPDVLNFIEQHSPLIRYRTYDVDFNVKPTAGGKLNPLAAIATAQNAFDVFMVRLAWWANYRKAARAGVGQEAAIRAAEDAATATNGNFERAALAPIYRSRLAKSVTQFTVSINNVLNYLRFDAGVQPTRLLRAIPQPRKTAPLFVKRAMNRMRLAGERLNPNPSTNPQTLKQLLFFIGTAMGLNALVTYSKLPIKQTGTSDILPGIGTLQGQAPATYALPVALGQRLLAKHPQEVSKADAAIWRGAWLQVKYGNQLRKTIEGLMAIAQGGSMTAKGRMRFPVQGGAEQFRAVAFGPYGTAKGQAYIQRGFKSEPLSEEQKQINRELRNYERSLMR